MHWRLIRYLFLLIFLHCYYNHSFLPCHLSPLASLGIIGIAIGYGAQCRCCKQDCPSVKICNKHGSRNIRCPPATQRDLNAHPSPPPTFPVAIISAKTNQATIPRPTYQYPSDHVCIRTALARRLSEDSLRGSLPPSLHCPRMVLVGRQASGKALCPS